MLFMLPHKNISVGLQANQPAPQVLYIAPVIDFIIEAAVSTRRKTYYSAVSLAPALCPFLEAHAEAGTCNAEWANAKVKLSNPKKP